MGRATEHLASRVGDAVGGLLNATLGNAAELIIAVTALIEASRNPEAAEFMHAVVKASLTGSIIGNILLVLGLAVLVGGIRHRVQNFNAVAARAGATLLTLAVVALVIPAVFSHLVPEKTDTIRELSVELSVLLLIVYGLSLLFTLHTHKHLYGTPPDANAPSDAQAEHWPVRRSVIVLVVVTVFIALLAEFMVGSIEAASHAFGLSDLFIGVVIVAIVGNAAEHSTAVLVAWRNRMDLALTIAVGSSTQIALFVAPFLVLFSLALGSPIDLVFSIPEVVAIALAVLILEQISSDGESHWLEGVLLLTVYAMLGVLFFHLPG